MLPTIPEGVVWAILLLPAASMLTIAFVTKPYPRISGYVTIACIALAFLFSLWALDSVIQSDGHALALGTHHWLSVATSNGVLRGIGGQNLQVDLALRVDGLSAIMLVVVTGVSLAVQVYSQGYMEGDTGYSRYFAYMSLFTGAMLGLVLFDSILVVYVFWELVGLGSYLLIGFWFHKKSAADAAKKAFLTTRLGDIGFLLAILLIWTKADTFNIPLIQSLAQNHKLSDTVLTLFALGIFAGAVGKSAQFPLHVWLPDAMEGPTPVSSLIHAATMVAAGVYLVARMYPVFQVSEEALKTVAYIGGFTAIFAASIGIVVTDIKRVLAYSTISQLGYMMLGLGVGAYSAGVFHLFNHAFFKALLFLAAGSVIHGAGEQDLFRLGGLRKQMPWTAATFLIGGLALAGIFPFAGFWSKDEIIAATYSSGQTLLFLFAMITVFLTAFYISRAWLLAFWGERRAPAHQESEDAASAHGGAHESPLVMVLPLVLLAIPAVVSGLLNSPLANGAFGHFLMPSEAAEPMNVTMALISTALALSGIGLAWLMYGAKVISASFLTLTFQPIYNLLENRYFMDRLYEDVIVRGIVIGFSNGIALFDKRVVDGAVNGVGWLVKNVVGYAVDRTESGRAPNYALSIFAGLVVIAVVVIANQLGMR